MDDLSGSGKQPASQSTTYLLQGNTLVTARTVWIALALLALVVFLGAIPPILEAKRSLAASYAEAASELGLSLDLLTGYLFAQDVILALVFAIPATLFFWLRSEDRTAIIFSAALVLFGLLLIDPLKAFAGAHPVWVVLAVLTQTLAEVAAAALLYLFPDGRFVPAWTRFLAIPIVIWRLVTNIVLASTLSAGPTSSVAASEPSTFEIIFSTLVFGVGIYSQIYRFRRISSPVGRQQTKWVVFALGMVLLGFFVVVVILPDIILPVLFQVEQLSGSPRLLYDLIVITLYRLTFILLPLAIGFSMLRYRLWDIDFFINRTLVYGALTGILAIVYVASVLVLQQLFHSLTGGEQPPIAIASSTLVIAGLFMPARRRLQNFIDRRFYGIHVNYRGATTLSGKSSYANSQFGSYQVLEPLGRGGMAEVYKGYHPTLNRMVAIKILTPNLAGESDFRTRFEREAQTVAGLRHPNIVNVFDFGEAEGTYYMVMEYIGGKDLGDYMTEVGRIPLSEVRPLMRDIASALDYAHEQGVVHRDVKPSNVMLQPATSPGAGNSPYRAVLMDFGIAKMLTGGTQLTRTGIVGTFDYMAPEQIRDSREVDGRTDVYSLGVVLYQMLTGQLPFSGGNPGAVLIAHLQQPPPDPRDTVNSLPANVAAAVKRALAKDPEERFATASALVEALG